MPEQPDIRNIKGIKIAIIGGEPLTSEMVKYLNQVAHIEVIVRSDRPVSDIELEKMLESDGFKAIPQEIPEIAPLIETLKPINTAITSYDIRNDIERKKELNKAQPWKPKHKRY